MKKRDQCLVRLEACVEASLGALGELPEEFSTQAIMKAAKGTDWEPWVLPCLLLCVDAQIIVRKIGENQRVYYRKTSLFEAPNVKELVIEHAKARRNFLEGWGSYGKVDDRDENELGEGG